MLPCYTRLMRDAVMTPATFSSIDALFLCPLLSRQKISSFSVFNLALYNNNKIYIFGACIGANDQSTSSISSFRY